jgi:hypothetical protein
MCAYEVVDLPSAPRRNRRLAICKHTNHKRELLGVLLADNLPVRVRKELQNVVQLLQCFLRAAELEMQAAEEPLKSDMNVAGLKVQVLERIETLEEQERERQEILSQLIPVMEARGYDTRALKAVLSS